MMKFLRRFQYWLRARQIEADLTEELELHRALTQDRLEQGGVPQEEAARASRRAIGNITLAREDARAVWIASWMERLWQDVRYGVRMLRRDPGFATIAILTLALGIGANTAIFSAVNAIVLRPLPYADSDRLVMLWTNDVKRGLHEETTSYLNFLDWRSQSRLFADMAIFRGEPVVILGGEAPDRVRAENVSANLFPLLGVAPAIGRTFTQEEQDQGEAVAVLNYGLWQRRFGGAHDVVGQMLTLDRFESVSLRVIGVMPAGFSFPNRDTQLWRPARRGRTEPRYRFFGGWGVIGRLKPGAISGSIKVADRPEEPVGQMASASVSPGFLEALSVPLRRGRFFSDADVLTQIRLLSLTSEEWAKRDAAYPVVVNQTFARRFAGDRDPVGTRFKIERFSYEIVGVAGDMHREGPERPVVAEYFTPYIGQTSELAVRTTGDPLALASTIRQTIRSIDKNAMVLSTTTLHRRLGELGAQRQAQTWLLTMFAGLALMLAGIGIYGIIRYTVAQRTPEIGIRIALGAQTSDILRLIVGQGMASPVLGAVIGLVCAFWLTAVMSNFLLEISATDPATFAAVGVILMVTALAASLLPARRAAKVDPIVALRCE